MSCMSSHESAVVDILDTFDFTVNQVAYALKSGIIVDPYEGLADINEGRLGLNRKAWISTSDRLLVNQCARLLEILESEQDLFIDETDARFLLEDVLPIVSGLPPEVVERRWATGKESLLLKMKLILDVGTY